MADFPIAGSSDRAYRIGFVSARDGAFERQAFVSLRQAAARLGHTAVRCRTTDEIEAAAPDFVIASDADLPRMTDAPTFFLLREGRARAWADPDSVRRLLTFDGYLTLSGPGARFARSLLAGLGRFEAVGRYGPTPHRADVRCDLAAILAGGRLQVGVVGEGMAMRSRALFLALSERPYARFHGPSEAWAFLEGRGVAGPVPFEDGAVQGLYAAYGAGLAPPNAETLADDLPPEGLFDIVAAGALAICPDTPWVREAFGDSVYLYNAAESDLGIANQIEEILAGIRADPQAAIQRGETARRIFEARFAAEVVLPEAIGHYEAWRADRARRAARLQDRTVDVVVRAGGRPLAALHAALQSIDRQTAGRVRVILALYRPMDVSPLINQAWARIEAITVVESPGGSRSATLRAGLAQLSSDYFAILDDDDYWLDNHLETLLEAADRLPAGHALAVSGVIACETGTSDGGERRRIHHLDAPAGNMFAVMAAFCIHAFLASRALLRPSVADGWDMQTGEDTALIGSLLADAELSYTWAPTAVYVLGAGDQSGFASRPDRAEDILQSFLRMGPGMERIERALAAPASRFWDTIGLLLKQAQAAPRAALAQPPEPVAMMEGRLVRPLDQRPDLRAVKIDLSRQVLGVRTVRKTDADGRPANESWFDEPWLFGLVARIKDQMPEGPQWLVARLTGVTGAIAAAAIDLDSGAVMAREVTLTGIPDVELWLPVPCPCDALALQCWDQGLHAPAVLRELWAVRPGEGQAVALQPEPRGLFRSEAARASEAAGRAEAVAAHRAEELAWQREVPPDPVLADDRAMPPLASRRDLAVRPLVLDDGLYLAAPGGADILGQGVAVRMDPSAEPWQYALVVQLGPRLEAGDGWIVVELGRTLQPLLVLLVDKAETKALRRVAVPGGRASAEIWLKVNNPGDVSGIVIQHGERPLEDPVMVRRITIARAAD